MKLKKIILSAIITSFCFTSVFSPVSFADTSYNTTDAVNLRNFLLCCETEDLSEKDYDLNDDSILNVFDYCLMRRQLMSVSTEIEKTGFIKADGRILKDETDNQYIIQGIAFGNNVWANPETPPENLHHTKASYKELSEMRFNSVRFYLNYGLFESDENPYTYSETGFEWIDKNIEQAKKYGIRLLLNMHYPQGGYQSQGNGEELWLNEENQKRLTALWTEIADRYSDEPAVLGYGIVNEPVVAVKESAEEGLTQWQKLAQEITNGIRTVDNNHIIFIEKMCAVEYIDTGLTEWKNFNDENNYVRIDDDNIVYEFHYYEPHMYTHQGFSWANTTDYDYTYPDETIVMTYDSQWAAGTFSGDRADISNSQWQYLESSYMTIDDMSYSMLSLVFQAKNLGEGGIVYADNLRLDEYDENGEFIKTVYYDDFSRSNQFYFWSADNSGSGFLSSSIGYDDNTSLCITDTTDDASFGKSNIAAVHGHKYKASGYIRVENAGANAVIMPRADAWSSDSSYVLNKEYLEYSLLENIKFSTENNLPVYCGEFGAGTNCFKNNRGGIQWVSDVIDICLENDISFNYHTYHEENFGLYQNSPLNPPSKRNDELYSLFISKLNSE